MAKTGPPVCPEQPGTEIPRTARSTATIYYAGHGLFVPGQVLNQQAHEDNLVPEACISAESEKMVMKFIS
ncbi:MAG: hypothetical protein P8L37_06070 [Phycisphaerales bacterium]|nr:hypothetical protein [Phycisphaerales bacterium]